MAIAICASVTVSIADAMIGMLTGIERVMRERISTSAGKTSDRPGIISTSSKVSPSRGLELFFPAIAISVLPQKGSSDRPAGVTNARFDGFHRLRHGTPLGWRESIA